MNVIIYYVSICEKLRSEPRHLIRDYSQWATVAWIVCSHYLISEIIKSTNDIPTFSQ
jgi:hypothetical protein